MPQIQAESERSLTYFCHKTKGQRGQVHYLPVTEKGNNNARLFPDRVKRLQIEPEQ